MSDRGDPVALGNFNREVMVVVTLQPNAVAHFNVVIFGFPSLFVRA
jgi:hypothetical protein